MIYFIVPFEFIIKNQTNNNAIFNFGNLLQNTGVSYKSFSQKCIFFPLEFIAKYVFRCD